MKKLLNISVIAALAVLPVAANATAADVDKNPGATIDQTTSEGQATAANATATNAPKYALVAAHDTDSNVATAGYVKGAYNASIRAINKVAEQVGEGLNDKANANLDNVTASSVTTTLIANDAVTADKIADNAVGTAQIVNDAVTADKIADGAVGADQLGANAVGTAKIADDAVTAAKIADGAVGADQLGANAVTTAKIADDAVTADKIADNAVDTAQIADGAVTADKLAAGALDGFATEAGVETTVTNALNGVSVTYDLSGLGVSTGAVTGSANAAITVMDTWGSNTAAAQTISAPVDLTSTVAVTGLTGNSSGQTATVTHGTVQYAEPANP